MQEEPIMIETTLNMHRTTKFKLNIASRKLGISRTRLILFLIQTLINTHDRPVSSFRRLRYQDKDEKGDWHCFHLSVNERDYELIQDVRKFFKMSISLFVALAVETDLKRIMNQIINGEKDTDKYPVSCYSIMRYISPAGEICWKLYWGLPFMETGEARASPGMI